MDRPTYNEKNFLLPDSPRSMASYHAKVMEDGIMNANDPRLQRKHSVA